MLCAVEGADEVGIGRQHHAASVGCLHFKKGVDGSVVYRLDGTHGLSVGGIDDLVAYDLGYGERRVGVLVSQLAREEHLTACELSGSVGSVNILPFDKRRLVGAETVGLKEERHEQTVDLHKHIVGIDAVEDVVVEEECHLALHAMRLAQATDTVDIVGVERRVRTAVVMVVFVHCCCTISFNTG